MRRCRWKNVDGQTTQSSFLSNMRHRHGLKVNYSAGEQAHYCNDERQTSAGLPARGRVCTFYLRTSLKGDSPGLAWKTTAGKGAGERAMGVQVHVQLPLGFQCVFFCVVYPFTRFISVLFITWWPLGPITSLVKDESYPLLLSCTTPGPGISIAIRRMEPLFFFFFFFLICGISSRCGKVIYR